MMPPHTMTPGPTPHARGALPVGVGQRPVEGTNPACAGNTVPELGVYPGSRLVSLTSRETGIAHPPPPCGQLGQPSRSPLGAFSSTKSPNVPRSRPFVRNLAYTAGTRHAPQTARTAAHTDWRAAPLGLTPRASVTTSAVPPPLPEGGSPFHTATSRSARFSSGHPPHRRILPGRKGPPRPGSGGLPAHRIRSVAAQPRLRPTPSPFRHAQPRQATTGCKP